MEIHVPSTEDDVKHGDLDFLLQILQCFTPSQVQNQNQRTSTGALASPGWLEWECTCAISVLGGAAPDVGADGVRGRDRPVSGPGVYWAPRRRGSAGWHRGPPRVSAGGGHSYEGGREEMQGRVNTTHRTYNAHKWGVGVVTSVG